MSGGVILRKCDARFLTNGAEGCVRGCEPAPANRSLYFVRARGVCDFITKGKIHRPPFLFWLWHREVVSFCLPERVCYHCPYFCRLPERVSEIYQEFRMHVLVNMVGNIVFQASSPINRLTLQRELPREFPKLLPQQSFQRLSRKRVSQRNVPRGISKRTFQDTSLRKFPRCLSFS